MQWFFALLDILMITAVCVGVYHALRLIKHLNGLRQGRLEMERFVYEFNATVVRAEAGIKGLRQAARDSGDDLEKLVEKAVLVRDELQFIVEHGDKVAERLSVAATGAMKPEIKATAPKAEAAAETAPKAEEKAPITTSPSPASQVTPLAGRKIETQTGPQPTSRAEKDLIQALKKLS